VNRITRLQQCIKLNPNACISKYCSKAAKMGFPPDFVIQILNVQDDENKQFPKTAGKTRVLRA
jgi:hypothetical protein